MNSRLSVRCVLDLPQVRVGEPNTNSKQLLYLVKWLEWYKPIQEEWQFSSRQCRRDEADL